MKVTKGEVSARPEETGRAHPKVTKGEASAKPEETGGWQGQSTLNQSMSKGNGGRLRPNHEARGHIQRRPEARLRPNPRRPEGGNDEARQIRAVLTTGSDPTTTSGIPSGKPTAVH
jgi:hypothetical protein